MALIKCPECGNSVSDKAANCPHCGMPLGDEFKQPNPEAQEPKPENKFIKPESESVKPENRKSSHNAGMFVGIAIALAVIIAIVMVFNNQSSNAAAQQVIDDLQGEWYSPMEHIARTLDVSGDEMTLSTETAIDWANETADEYTFTIKPKSENVIEASSYSDNYKEYTIEFNEDKTKFTITPALLSIEDSETWYAGEPEFEEETSTESSSSEDDNLYFYDEENEIAFEIESIGFIDDFTIGYEGRVANLSDQPANNIEVSVNLYNDDGKKVFSTYELVYCKDDPIGAGETADVSGNCTGGGRDEASYVDIVVTSVDFE